MPPKKTQKGPSKKADEKQKKQAIEDKTFGLKNKNKSAKVGKYVKQVEKQVMDSGNRKLKEAADKRRAQVEKKEAEKKRQEELGELFSPVQVAQKVPFGVDPKSVLCVNFKAGHCEKGAKCKFSHDANVGRKSAKMDLYTDKRDVQADDTMDKWDQSRLEEVVLSKHGNPQTTTEIVCKYFLEAIEDCKYGWFWECPNGGDKCRYKHALPPGFVLKRDQKAEVKDEISLEEFLETERHKLGSNLTPVTLESFTAWKAARRERREAEDLKSRQAKEKAYRAGKLANMSGRDFFEFNPETGDDDGDDSFDFAQYRNADGGYQQDTVAYGRDAEAAAEGLGELSLDGDA
ncbi:Translation machinery-associated protein 46 [Coemansia javaensis]|uniref:Translation machinery-associated protein 46 n=1 Tax=Coemansia javaensis TaxID=2761396 RepID=A0A9W8LKJ6_9FUNG|nr:Translation machinery-associated protein 46 [Coemansia javaensis]